MQQPKYPILEKTFHWKKLVYLDAACTAIRDDSFIQSASAYYSDFSCCAWDRESSYLGWMLFEKITEVRWDIRKFLWADSRDFIIFRASTTDAINGLAYSLSENIKTFVVSDFEHNSNFWPWFEITKHHNGDMFVCEYDKLFNPESLREYLSGLSKPFLFTCTHASNILWWVVDIRIIADLVHEYGGYIMVDDAQYVPSHQEDVTRNQIDFIVFSGHKLGWPTGIGVLYIKHGCESFITKSDRIGGWTLRKIENNIPMYKHLPDFLEWGVQNFSGIIGLWHVIEKRLYLPKDTILLHIEELIAFFMKLFYQYHLDEYMNIISKPGWSLITIVPKTFQAIDFHQYCNHFFPDYIIAFRTGSFCADTFVSKYMNNSKNIMRFSFGLYNTKEDIIILMRAITQYLWLEKN